MTVSSHAHIPVLMKEVIAMLNIADKGIFVDGTFGNGGYSKAMLAHKNSFIFAIDRDPDAFIRGQEMEKDYPGRFKMMEGRFSHMQALLAKQGIEHVDGIVLDIGVSSQQIDDPARGFSFRFKGPLDMRMEQKGLSAAEVVNTLSETDLATLIYTWGEERFSRRIARNIIYKRAEEPFTTTDQLADLVRSVVPRHKDGLDPATRTFQALRIYVNEELKELQMALEASEQILKPGGRLVVVSFHSLEDQCVKKFLKERSQAALSASRHAPPFLGLREPTFKLLTLRAIIPSSEECQSNPRARSAKLRAAQRIDTLIANEVH